MDHDPHENPLKRKFCASNITFETTPIPSTLGQGLSQGQQGLGNLPYESAICMADNQSLAVTWWSERRAMKGMRIID